MTRKICRNLITIAVVAMLALTTMTATVCAATNGEKSPWHLNNTTAPSWPGYVTGLVKGDDTGVDFVCTSINGGIKARSELDDSRLLLNYGEGVYVDKLGWNGTILFNRDWDLYAPDGRVIYNIWVYSGTGSMSGYAY